MFFPLNASRTKTLVFEVAIQTAIPRPDHLPIKKTSNLIVLSLGVLFAGTSKTAEPYKVGKKTTDTMVEILNLDKTEIISIDTISNQEFTEVIGFNT